MDNNKNSDETIAGQSPPIISDESIIGRQTDDYKIIEEIGHGGMALVYKARQISLDRDVALKIIPRELIEEPEYVERFKREASAAANLNHPNIVSIHGFGRFRNTYYYVMDLVRGRTLDKILEEKKHSPVRGSRRFSLNESIRIISQAAAGLAYAHSRGIIHRDIKPGNLFIEDNTNRVLITDFGLARSVHWEKITPRASLFGTPAYMSYEQARGNALDFRTDIYSLGAVFYELLTGVEPYKGENALDIIEKVKTEPIELPHKLNSDISPKLESIVIKAMSKDIFLRYQTMNEFINAIEQFSSDRETAVFTDIAETKIRERGRLKKRKNRFLIILFTVIGITAVFLAGVSGILSRVYLYLKR